MAHVNYAMYVHESGSTVACHCSCLIKTEGLLKVTGRHVHSKYHNRPISETEHDETLLIQTTNRKAIIWPIPNSGKLSDLERSSTSRSFTYCKPFFSCNFSNSSATVDTILADSASHGPCEIAEPLVLHSVCAGPMCDCVLFCIRCFACVDSVVIEINGLCENRPVVEQIEVRPTRTCRKQEKWTYC